MEVIKYLEVPALPSLQPLETTHLLPVSGHAILDISCKWTHTVCPCVWLLSLCIVRFICVIPFGGTNYCMLNNWED